MRAYERYDVRKIIIALNFEERYAQKSSDAVHPD